MAKQQKENKNLLTLNEPQNQPMLILKEWHVDACGGDLAAACVLSYLLFWHCKKTDGGDSIQWHSAEDLSAGIMRLYSPKRCREAIHRLAHYGFVEILMHGGGRNKNAYTINIDNVNKFLDKKQEFLKDNKLSDTLRSPGKSQ